MSGRGRRRINLRRRRKLVQLPHAARRPRRRSTNWEVWVEYEGVPLTDDDRDQDIERAIGKRSAASGYQFIDGIRDLSFTFRNERGARQALERVRELKLKSAGGRARLVGPWR